jgi:hypothetical protein
MFAIVVVLSALAQFASEGHFVPGVRRIAIASRDSLYDRFETQIIDSEAKLATFLKPFNRKNEFERGGGKDDYPSGSIRVRFQLWADADGTLNAKINRVLPRGLTADRAHYCFAFTVSKEREKHLVMWEETRLGFMTLPAKP